MADTSNEKIGEMIQESIDLMERGLYEKAFARVAFVCQETIKKDLEKDELILSDYKNFIDEHWHLISFMCFPRSKSPYLDLQFVIKEISLNPRRNYTVKEIAVYLLTYTLKHKKNPSDISFFSGSNFEVNNNRLFIPGTYVSGLLGLMVVHPVNKDESIPDKYWINISDFKMFVSELWGRIDIAERVRKFYLSR